MNTEDYFLAGRNIGWFGVGSSIFASNIGSEHVVGLAGTGAAGKFPLIIYELHAWVVLMMGWIFLPFYARSGVFTMPEFLEKDAMYFNINDINKSVDTLINILYEFYNRKHLKNNNKLDNYKWSNVCLKYLNIFNNYEK